MIQNYLTITLLFIGIYSYSQENKNKIMLNGNFNYATEKKRPVTIDHSTYYNSKRAVDLNIGYFLTKNFAIGISGSYQKKVIRREFTYTIESAEVYYSSGLFARYNCMTKGKKFGFFFQANSNVYVNEWRENIKDDNTTATEKEKANGMNVILTPGVIYFLNHKFSVEASVMNITYDHFTVKDGLSNRSINSGFATNFSPSSIYVGFSYYFVGKKNETVKAAL
jgi:hypothetical protein